MTQYKIVVSHSGEDLSKKVTELIGDGWKPVGSHQVQVKHQQNRFRGQQHVDTLNELEYTQTMVKENTKIETPIDEMVSVLKTLKEDAEMALSGDWDRGDHGFEAQIILIDRTLDKY
jgi:hypothetical protein